MDVYKMLVYLSKDVFEKNVNFVMIRVWMYTKYCLFGKFLKKTIVYENFVCFDLSKQTRRSTLSCKVFILFPLKIYPFIGYKRKVRFCTQNSRILTLILKRMRKDYLKRCKCDCDWIQIFYL